MPFSNIFTYIIHMDPEWKNYVTVGCQWAESHPRNDVEINKFYRIKYYCRGYTMELATN